MRNRAALFRTSITISSIALAGAAPALDPEQFVAGWPIEAPPAAKVFDVPLTADVYAAAASLEQLAVLDANGEPQSFFRLSPPPVRPTEQRLVLEASPASLGGSVAPGVGVTQSRNGLIVTVAPGTPSDAEVTSFVLDARAVDWVPVALELDWRALPQPFLLEVNIEQSSDLSAWRSVGSGAVAALDIGGSEVRHARVPVRATDGGFYRITPSRTVADWRLLRATLVRTTAEPPAPLELRARPLPASAAPADASPEALFFDAGGMLPVGAVTLGFGAGDGWARADLAASRSLDGPWLPVARGELFYTLSIETEEFTSTPLAVGRQEARFWRVVPAAPLRGQRLELVLSFPQESLRVAAGGAAPYLLVGGARAREAGPDATLAAVWSRVQAEAQIVPLGSLGARRELGGPAVLTAPRPFPWRLTALWAVLIGGVLVVGAMAVRLAREMHSPPL